MTIETHNTNPKPTKPRRWFRFRLRTLLVIVTLLSVPLGWIGWELDQRRREKATIAWVEKMGGRVDGWLVGFYFEVGSDQKNWWETTKDKWFGERVQGVDFSPSPYEVYSLDPPPLQVGDLSPLQELKNLEVLILFNTNVNDLSPLAELKNLTTLFLYATEVSDLSPLAELKNLKSLRLDDTEVSDLSPLAELKNLGTLYLNGTQVSDEQVQVLRQALPNCDIRLSD